MTLSTPKPGTGIKLSLFKPYQFQDQAWADPSHFHHAKFAHLAHHCVLVGESYFVRDKLTGYWRKVSKTGVIPKLLNERGGTVPLNGALVAITKDDFGSFLCHGIVSFDAVTYAPGAGDFVLFQHEKRLNLYRDQRVDGDTDDLPHIGSLRVSLRVRTRAPTGCVPP